MNTLPLISIIIPCYNSGAFIREAIRSVEEYPDTSLYEIIIVNDGSTEELTIQVLNNLTLEGYSIVNQANKGPAAARNTGVKLAKGQYILLLDSDNRIRPAYIDKGIELMTNHPDVGVVYSNVHFFGEHDGIKFEPRPFDMPSILAQNYIDNCAVIRKSVWEELGGFDEEKILIGHEDWDFWIRVGSSKWKFCYIDRILFDYRLRKDSLINQATQREKFLLMHEYIARKNALLYVHHYKKLHSYYKMYLNDQKRPIHSFFKYMKNKFSK